jgi:ribosomal protein L31
MRRQSAVWALAIVTAALALAACGSSSPSSSTTSKTAIAPAAALATGTYAPTGSSGTPHYVIDISSANGTAFNGTMKFVYQDGTTSRVFDFSGTVTGQSATAKPTNVAAPGSATKTVSSVPSSLQIAVGSDALTFEGCQSYLPEALSASACTFNQSR